jgi:hypothetical protein
MGEVFIGSEAVSSARLTRHELQRWYRPIFRGIYVPKHSHPSLRDRTVGAWLASDRQAAIAGASASALHGGKCRPRSNAVRARVVTGRPATLVISSSTNVSLLLFIDAGLPRPTTQIPVIDERGRLVRILDMGWEDFMVGAEYDGDQHRTNREQYVKDLRVWPKLERMGWNVTRVIKEDREDDIIARTWSAMVSRGWNP